MGLKTIPFRKLEEHTEDIFEAVTIIAKRARKIIGDRYIIQEELRREEENLEEIGGDTELPSFEMDSIDREEFEKVAKPTTQSIDELLTGEIDWKYEESESAEEDEEGAE